MSIPLLEYTTKSENHRVDGFEVPGEEQPNRYKAGQGGIATDVDISISTAYRQIWNEQQMLSHYRQRFLESQLRSGQITVKDFIRGLLLSASFRNLVFDTNNNYRFAEICVQRVLGRNVYSDREKIAWSIVLATSGLNGFVDALLASDEYNDNFGDHTVPYQRRRILPQHDRGETTFNHMARYGTDYRDKLPKSSYGGRGGARLSYTRWEWQRNLPKELQQTWIALFYFGLAFIVLMFGVTVLGY
ncbi:Phycobilisome linker polypeptide (plasmid) [Thalassoporum mexicanum PCC 7367]|uniref:phycobilisome rod-core linker polypeptide n=1 Tax=Thalassoporum mexicanum TaxID=3457544 RepID=UPI00029FE7A1|nr:phycobilisome rod-core linker polypeptide [Pseudanabaena sp. PCC 7367]AFY72121.1 Phycobilisome linker polypeptide [Pseudanabaena sp. PCC 7367]